jgi:hypothetical protein
VTLSRKGPKSRSRAGGLRSKTTKAKTPVDRLRAANADLNNADLKKKLAEALAQQTATAEILGIISSSPTDVQPVFDTIVRNFVSLCGSTFGAIYTFDGELVHFASAYGFSPDQIAGLKAKYPVHVNDRSVLSSRAILAKKSVHIQDVMLDPYYDRQHAALSDSRRLLAVPMLREGIPLGAIVAAWAEAGATPKQHEDLLKVFAAQAVIAIENTRLLKELRQRTDDLSESLEQQTATAQVLRVISSSPGQLEPVFQAMLENAVRLCEAKSAISISATETASAWLPRTTPRQLMLRRVGTTRCSGRFRTRRLRLWRPQNRSLTSPTSQRYRPTSRAIRSLLSVSNSADIGPCLPSQWSRTMSWSVQSHLLARRWDCSPIGK